MKKKMAAVFLICIFLIGLSLLLYPVVSQWWNARRQSEIIADYQEQVQDLESEHYAEIWEKAIRYNEKSKQREGPLLQTQQEKEEYQDVLNMGGTGIMGYLEIPAIDVELPIYHGVDRGVLQVALGHLEWSSLPIGGENTHTVLSGHRGLPSAELLTHLDQMEEGDIFYLRILNEVLYYEVDQILIVEPENLTNLLPEPGKDLCTLVTCTPYGVNSHRLLVRGHRVEQKEQETAPPHVVADAAVVNKKLVAAVIALPILLGAAVILLKQKKGNKEI